jgi:hypothetical protein
MLPRMLPPNLPPGAPHGRPETTRRWAGMLRRQVPSLLPNRMEPETNRALKKLASLAQLAADRVTSRSVV